MFSSSITKAVQILQAMILCSVLAWIPMVLIAILNGLVRESTYGKFLSQSRAHQVSTATGVFLFGVYIFMLLSVWKLESSGQALMMGFLWLGLTIVFEFSLGHFVVKHSWSQLLNDYNIFAGRIWIVVLIWIAIAPWLFYQVLA